VIKKEGRFQVATNFFLSPMNPENQPKFGRYATADKMLKNKKTYTVAYFRSVLYSVRNPRATVFSNIYDLQNLIIYIYHNRNFDEHIKIDILKELQYDEHSYYLPDCFSNLNLLKPLDDEEINTPLYCLRINETFHRFQQLAVVHCLSS
jgi:hypothetical protein